MMRSLLFPRRAAQSAILALLVAVVGLIGPFAPERPVTAQPAAPLPTELRYVPPDAAFFLYADAAAIWSHDATKNFRAADKNTFGSLEEQAIKFSGMKIEDLKTVAVFFPKVKEPQDTNKAGFVLTFTTPFDKKKLETGLAGLFDRNAKLKVFAPDEKTAVVLLGLDDAFAKPQEPTADGPLSPALKAAASGKHALVAGVTFANLPDELRKDDLPGEVRGFQPIFLSDSLTATVGLGKSVDLDVRVKTKRAGQAADAEKALGALAKLLGDELTGTLPKLEKEAAMKDAVTVLKALLATAKGAKFEVDGTEARMTATLPLAGLPLASAYTGAVQKVQQAAAVQKSANNLKQIALAMHNYASANNDAFPPAAVCDKKGKPQLSWRVLILPYIEHEVLYKQFKLDEPWDSANNKKLIAKMPAVYALPGTSKPGDTDTYYRVFVGNGAAFDWLTGTKIVGIPDGTSNTIMCVTAATAVPWTQPDELEFDPDKDMTKLLGLVNGTAQIALCDGSVRTLAKLPSKETLGALITKNGAEVIGNDF